MPSFDVFLTALRGWNTWGSELKRVACLWHPSPSLPLASGLASCPTYNQWVILDFWLQQKGHRGASKARWEATFPFLPWSLGMLTLGDASCHGRSLTTFRSACCEVPLAMWRGPTAREFPTQPRCQTGEWKIHHEHWACPNRMTSTQLPSD